MGTDHRGLFRVRTLAFTLSDLGATDSSEQREGQDVT